MERIRYLNESSRRGGGLFGLLVPEEDDAIVIQMEQEAEKMNTVTQTKISDPQITSLTIHSQTISPTLLIIMKKKNSFPLPPSHHKE